eukprot:CAMPEP_0116902978 /NCGR_PEP_ID=MMETSP0467-20121206/10432_1 /TAXON_ID=283647 /ORGANISM="Mesodinium pulex, Strain SPMC105" /LENGTH=117 /DNA_ID=CAMNT_0004577109 /DNA_START=846 /DNA_END=1199 /DNA_ORIENTATION=-
MRHKSYDMLFTIVIVHDLIHNLDAIDQKFRMFTEANFETTEMEQEYFQLLEPFNYKNLRDSRADYECDVTYPNIVCSKIHFEFVKEKSKIYNKDSVVHITHNVDDNRYIIKQQAFIV